ncbi:MAG: phosphatase PAP2 family protein [Salinisphaera sp.]|jgi:undecaprenyl-diphosphatase|nr:phosphatase PAP2 family protein [Salinisphaera sp.]
MNPFDLNIFHFLNHFAGHHPVVDLVMIGFARYSPLLYALLFIIAWFAQPRGERPQRHALVVAAGAGVLALLINMVIAHFWFRPRPFAVLPHDSFIQLIPHGADASFPSDHVSGAFGFSAGCWGRAARWVSWSFTLIAVMVMVARVYTGVHWPTDVIAGLVVGIVAGRAVWLISSLFRPLTRIGLYVTGQTVR